jgi:hypothetical protein
MEDQSVGPAILRNKTNGGSWDRYTPDRDLYHLRSIAKFDFWLLRRKQRL